MPDDILKDLPQRLESMVTRWSLVRVAHDASGSSASKARNELVLRYSDATKNYIRGIVRDEASAEEIAQHAVLRMLSGDFAGADPNRGRFRDLLKVATRNMVRNHWAKEKSDERLPWMSNRWKTPTRPRMSRPGSRTGGRTRST